MLTLKYCTFIIKSIKRNCNIINLTQ